MQGVSGVPVVPEVQELQEVYKVPEEQEWPPLHETHKVELIFSLSIQV